MLPKAPHHLNWRNEPGCSYTQIGAYHVCTRYKFESSFWKTFVMLLNDIKHDMFNTVEMEVTLSLTTVLLPEMSFKWRTSNCLWSQTLHRKGPFKKRFVCVNRCFPPLSHRLERCFRRNGEKQTVCTIMWMWIHVQYTCSEYNDQIFLENPAFSCLLLRSCGYLGKLSSFIVVLHDDVLLYFEVHKIVCSDQIIMG